MLAGQLGTMPRIVRVGRRRTRTAPAFSPDDRTLATGGNGGTGILWNVTDPTPRPAKITTLPAIHAAESAFAFFPDGHTLAAGYDNGTVILWNISRPAHIIRVATLAGRADGPHGLSISPDGHLLAAASTTSPGTVALWDVADPAHAARLAVLTGQAGQSGGISALSFSPDGHLLATASDNGSVVLRDVSDPAAPVITATLRFTVPPPGRSRSPRTGAPSPGRPRPATRSPCGPCRKAKAPRAHCAFPIHRTSRS